MTANKNLTPNIMQELFLYHCAGGHTRTQMAKAALIRAGFTFNDGAIYWPDGVKLTYNKEGNICARPEHNREAR